METTTLAVAATLDAPPEEVFRVLTSAAEHSAFTGAESTVDARVGGRFSHYGGGLAGVFEAIEAPKRLVQRLRAADWPEGHHAQVRYELAAVAEGRRTHVKVREHGVPSARLDEVAEGWQGYWEAFGTHLRERRVDVVRRFVEEYKNRQNPDVVDALVSADCAVHIPLPGLPQGREGMRLNGRLMCGAFPDVRVTRDFFVTEGDVVVERAKAVATHAGPLMGSAPTGRRVTWTELHAYRVEGGLIAEVWSEADFMGVMVQIGAVEPPGADGPGRLQDGGSASR